MTLTRTNLINTILDRSNKFRTDLQVVFNTYTNSSIDSLSDKIEETIHRTNYNLCNRFLKNGRERVNLIGFIEVAHNNTHAHVFLRIPERYEEARVLRLLNYHFRKLDRRVNPTTPYKVYQGEARKDLEFFNVKYATKDYKRDNEDYTFIYY